MNSNSSNWLQSSPLTANHRDYSPFSALARDNTINGSYKGDAAPRAKGHAR